MEEYMTPTERLEIRWQLERIANALEVLALNAAVDQILPHDVAHPLWSTVIKKRRELCLNYIMKVKE